MNRMAQSCGPRATRCAASAIWRRSLIRLRIITTRLEALGAQCVNCHMPTKTYMVVHDRRDHSIRVPRPDLSLSIGTPNACNQCHAERSAEWAANAIAIWYPNGRQTKPHYGTGIQAGRLGAIDAEKQLDQLIVDQNQPAIARATGVLLLPSYATSASHHAVEKAIADPDPLVRMAAARNLPLLLPPPFPEAALSLLSDPMRAVRTEAARSDPCCAMPRARSRSARLCWKAFTSGTRLIGMF